MVKLNATAEAMLAAHPDLMADLEKVSDNARMVINLWAEMDQANRAKLMHVLEEQVKGKEILGNVMYDLTEAAALLGVTRRTCHQYVLDGKIAAQKIGKKWLLNQDAIQAFLQGEKQSTSDNTQSRKLKRP